MSLDCLGNILKFKALNYTIIKIIHDVKPLHLKSEVPPLTAKLEIMQAGPGLLTCSLRDSTEQIPVATFLIGNNVIYPERNKRYFKDTKKGRRSCIQERKE